jgi:hypothetical protein
MPRNGNQAVNRALGKYSHIVIHDPGGKIDHPRITEIKDESMNTWVSDAQFPTGTGHRLGLRVRRVITAKEHLTPPDTGTLSVTLTDDTNTPDTIVVAVEYVDDSTIPCP